MASNQNVYQVKLNEIEEKFKKSDNEKTLVYKIIFRENGS